MAQDEFEYTIDDELVDKTANRERLNDTFEALISRCKNVGINYEVIDFEPDEKYLKILMPSGRDKRSVLIGTQEKAEALLKIQFEDYVLIPGYDAICSYSKGEIEALVKSLGAISPITQVYRTIFGIENREDYENLPNITLLPKDTQSHVTLTFGLASDECSLLGDSWRPSINRKPLSLRISGVNISQIDEAINYLERLSDSFFFSLDLSVNITLSLSRARHVLERRPIKRLHNKAELVFPQYEYDHEAMSLYWYGRSARGMPLLQYLAYYQAVEVYFPTYSQLDAQKRVRIILKDPSFNALRDTDIGRVLTAIRISGNKGFGNERMQLRSTIQECVNPEALRNFFASDEKRAEFFASKQKKISGHRIVLTNPEVDLRNDVAERIYDIRCKIVHTKDIGEGEDETLNLLLPFSKEAELLYYDIELMQYIAQQVLIMSSTTFRGT
jgi:hypothetical protein